MMKINIDNKSYKVNSGMTVLEAADRNGIYIPRMCAHPELVPYGGCRLCIVEIEGMKGYPTSCTTMVEDGMIIRTNTNMLQQMRLDLLQLILSEHPAACLLCEDYEGCSMFQETIRKVGVTTGCRWCPKDQDCELQRVVESFDIHEISLPGLYRDLPVEKFDPFFDRDYNLCIYCGRCVRICNEYRKSSVITLRQRGKHTTIGPSFDNNHTDAGCEYCGACVSVCPTGAMSEKSRKWWGLPDTYTKSVCPLCSINCEIQVLSLKNKIVGTIPPGKPHETAGELCVKGRFCLSEIVNRTERILEPRFLFPEGEGIIGWKEAFRHGAELINKAGEGKSAIFISPDMSPEEYIAVAEFAEKVLRTDYVTSSCMDSVNIEYLGLALKSIPPDAVKESTSILSFFLNGNYNYGPLTMAVKNAASSGLPYNQIGLIKDTTSRFADNFITPRPGEEISILDEIIKGIEGKAVSKPVIAGIANELKNGKKPLIITGPSLMSLTGLKQIVQRINRILDITEARIYAPDPYGNIRGMLSALRMKPFEMVKGKVEKGEIDLIYMIGDMPFFKRSAECRIIYQSAFPAPMELQPDLVLPSTVWGESTGTWPGNNGKPVKIKRAATAHDYARSNTDIMRYLSASVGKPWPAGRKKIAVIPDHLPVLPEAEPGSLKTARLNGEEKHPFVFMNEKSAHDYHNLHLDKAIEGLNELVSPGYLIISQSDAGKLDIGDGDRIIIGDNEYEHSGPARIRKNVPHGVIYMTGSEYPNGFKSNPCYVNLRRENV